MKILAFDCATAACSAVVWADGRVLAREGAPAARATDALVPMLARILREAGLGLADMDRLAVTIGPGHFTGLRAGLAVARGLVLASGLPAVAVTTLEAIAAGTDPAARRGHRLLIAIDSKRSEPYLQMFDASLAPLGPPESLSADAFAASLGRAEPLLVAGDAGPVMVAALARAGHMAALADAPANPDPAVVAALAASRAPLSGPIRPFYLHPPAAKLPATRAAS